MNRQLQILADFNQSTESALWRLAMIAEALRPKKDEKAIDNLQTIINVCNENEDWRREIRDVVMELIANRNAVYLFVVSAIYPVTGVFTETWQRLSYKILPNAQNETQLKYVLEYIFVQSDINWLHTISPENWKDLIQALQFEKFSDEKVVSHFVSDLDEAVRIVSHQIVAASIEPEMLFLDPSLEKHESPFLALCEETLAFAKEIDFYRECGLSDNDDEKSQTDIDPRHIFVLIDQSRSAIKRVKNRAQQYGASFNITFRLHRLNQLLDRLEILVDMSTALVLRQQDKVLQQGSILFTLLLKAACLRYELRGFWKKNAELIALRVTENAGKSGEHYISKTRSEYFAMFCSAAGGGFIIAFMAAFKLYLGTLNLPPLILVLAWCLNYGLGFVLIHIMHFTVATKQPAMTANAIASAIGEMQEGNREQKKNPIVVVTLIAQTIRSQSAAIIGNVGLAVPIAMLFALVYWWINGYHYASVEKAQYLLNEINPIAGAAIIYAAIAGVCLFLAGLVAGYYDNLCSYNRIPSRLQQLKLPNNLFGKIRWQRFTEYINNNLGALTGNFAFGFLLGGVSGLGLLLGLPLDIRHIAFSSAFWGYALVSLEFAVSWQVVILTIIGVFLIGVFNLLVSFYLAMSIGLKARRVDFQQRFILFKTLINYFISNPREFFLPPKNDGNSQEKTEDVSKNQLNTNNIDGLETKKQNDTSK